MILIEESATASAVGVDLMTQTEVGIRYQRSPRWRKLRGIALTGANAAGEQAILVKVAGADVGGGRIYTARTGKVPVLPDDYRPVGVLIPAGIALQLIVDKVSSVNVGVVHLDLDPPL